MPELPEVETIKKGLSKYLVGHKIEAVEIKVPKIFKDNPIQIIGAKVIGVRRFAKVLSIDLDSKKSVLVHVKMTGQLIYRGPNLVTPKVLSKKVTGIPGSHTRVTFKLDKGGILYYNDLRMFGWIKIVNTEDVLTTGFIEKLGPEPFKDLTENMFISILAGSRTMVKVVLMDQSKIGGIGNIYANDALWLAKINPKRPANSLNIKEVKLLYKSVLEVLEKSLKEGGASDAEFVTAEGTEGNYQKYFLVYNKQGTICPRCKKEKITKFFLGGRGTYFCPKCQAK